jgi:hypothetical protein
MATPTLTVYTATLNVDAASKAEESAFRTWDAANDSARNMANRFAGSFETFDKLSKLAKAMSNCALLKVEALDSGYKLTEALDARVAATRVYEAAMVIVDSWDSTRIHGEGFNAQYHERRISVACGYLKGAQIGEAFTLAEGYCPKA